MQMGRQVGRFVDGCVGGYADGCAGGWVGRWRDK